jgi:hypothetical protein
MVRTVRPCPKCAYDLCGIPWQPTAITCPECGTTSDPAAIKTVVVPKFTRPLLLQICGPVAVLIVLGLATERGMAYAGAARSHADGALYVLATLWSLGAPWIVVRNRLKTYRYSRWLALDELAGAYGFCLITFVAVFLLHRFIFVR